MANYAPFFVPANLEKTKLDIRIYPHASNHIWRPCQLDTISRDLGYRCSIWSNTIQIAQRDVVSMSKQFAKQYGVHSGILHYLPLMVDVDYIICIDPKRKSVRPISRLEWRNEELKWRCKIYASNLLQAQQATLTLEDKIADKSKQKGK